MGNAFGACNDATATHDDTDDLKIVQDLKKHEKPVKDGPVPTQLPQLLPLSQEPASPTRQSRSVERKRASSMGAALQPTSNTPLPRQQRSNTTIETDTVEIFRNEQGQKQVNQYIVFKGHIGRGSYGKVKKVFNTKDKRFYAMKMMNKTLLKKRRIVGKDQQNNQEISDQWQNVLREIAIMKKLNHPNIVRLHEVMDDTERDTLYLVIEFMEKGAVGDGELESQPLPIDLARKYFRDLIQGLHYLHCQKVVHRDIKPENLLLSQNGTVKIADFGVSHLFDGDNDRVRNTAGSAAFMAPEMCEGIETFSGKMTDVWSSGVTLFVFVFGRCPFMAPTVHQIYQAIVEQPLAFPRAVDDEALVDLFKRMLDKNPNSRSTVEQVMAHPWVTKKGTWPLTESKSSEVDVSQAEISTALTLVTKFVMLVRLKGVMHKKAMRIRKKSEDEREHDDKEYVT